MHSRKPGPRVWPPQPADPWPHEDHVVQRMTNGHIPVIGHEGQQEVLCTTKGQYQKHLKGIAPKGDGVFTEQKIHDGLGSDNRREEASTVMTRSSRPLLVRASVYRTIIVAQSSSGDPLSFRIPINMKPLPRVEFQCSILCCFFSCLKTNGSLVNFCYDGFIVLYHQSSHRMANMNPVR